MASVAFLRASLIVSIASITTAFTITPTTDAVTVRRGEQLQMSCDIGLEAWDTLSDIQEVRWFRGSNIMPLYGSLDVSRCNAGVFMCSNETTIDGRGTVHYAVTRPNSGTSTLTISSSLLEDNTTFQCAFLPETHQSAEIHVTVNYLPSTAYPICAVSSIQSEALTYVLVCSSDKGQPVVSLEWTTLIDSSRMSLSNTTVVMGNQVENTLHLSPVGTVYDNSIFTCYMTSTAYPGVIRNCSIGPDIVFPSSIPKAISTSPEVVSRLQDMTISTGCASLTSTTSAPDSGIPGQGGNNTTAPLGQTQDSTATSGQGKNSPSEETTFSPITPTAIVTTSFPDASSSTVSIVISAVSVVIIITLLAIIAYLVASRRKLQKILKENRPLVPKDCQDPKDLAVHINRSFSATTNNDQQPGSGMSLQVTVQDRPPVNSADSSLGPNHTYETSILSTNTTLPLDDVDQIIAQANINDGYTPYIVSEDGENSATQNTADSGYMPLALYEDI